MSQQHAEPRGLIAELRRSIAATAEDPPQAGIKLMMSAEDIAAIRGCTAAAVRDKHRQWTEKNGFPKPIPGMAPLVWSGPQFMAWLRGEQTGSPAITGTPMTATEVISRLHQKYGGGR